jgi:hypothetical protein
MTTAMGIFRKQGVHDEMFAFQDRPILGKPQRAGAKPP